MGAQNFNFAAKFLQNVKNITQMQ